MGIDPLAVQNVSADERWDDTLDALALAVTRDMAERGLLHDDAHEAARYHIRGFARRLVNPLLDQVRLEVQAGHRDALRLSAANERLRARLDAQHRTRRRGWVLAGLLGAVWIVLVLAVGVALRDTVATAAPAAAAAPFAAAAPTPAPAPLPAR